jgi:N6-adenosine-specific RNA methylase IME4
LPKTDAQFDVFEYPRPAARKAVQPDGAPAAVFDRPITSAAVTAFAKPATPAIRSGPLGELPQGMFRVVLGDPPWNFLTYSSRGWRKSAHAHYACMPLDEICALPVARLCAPDAVCVLWVTQTHVEQSFRVMRAFGFEPKTLGAWAKQSSTGRSWAFGTGYLLRSAAEFFLIGTRGRPRQLSSSTRNLIVAPVRGHSVKPDAMYELIERTWPGPYVELFAVRPREGWISWGQPSVPFERRIPTKICLFDLWNEEM